ncbi:MAG: hypothetical protein ACQCXQ_00850 [Verrucomicrobiales bacterium]|nr:hypothetical protein [Verrucomicrobiota bacterium JB025]
MSWWIFIHFYLWQNSLRRWWEQPLSLLSKLVISGLLGMLGAVVILGLKDLGGRLDARLRDKEILGVVLSESIVSPGRALDNLPGEFPREAWGAEGEMLVYYQTSVWADVEGVGRCPVLAVDDPEQLGFVDDLFLLSEDRMTGIPLNLTMGNFGSEAVVARPTEDIVNLMGRDDVVLGSADRLAGALVKGFIRTTVVHANSIEHVRKIHATVAAMAKVEDRRPRLRSNLRILEELEKVRDMQRSALLFVTIGASLVLGLVFGSLAWMEFREERYLLSLIRSFGVGRMTLLAHALVENTLLAVGGVLLGFLVLRVGASQLDLAALQIPWLDSSYLLASGEGRQLVLGAALGGVLSCVPVAIGLRKPLGLILK